MEGTKKFCKNFIHGFKDSFHGFKTVYTNLTRPGQVNGETFKQLFLKNFELNLMANVLCVYILRLAILPVTLYLFRQYLWLLMGPEADPDLAEQWIPFFQGLFSFLFCYPTFFLVQFISSYRFSTLANNSYEALYGRSRTATNFETLPSLLADVCTDFLIQIILNGQYFLFLWFIPGVVGALGQIFINSALTSFYCFNYKYASRGWTLEQRLHFIESSWPYFLGFGFPMSMLFYVFFLFNVETSVCGGIYAIYCPILIVAAIQRPAPSGKDNKPFNLPLFTPTLWILNLFWKLPFIKNL